ncbi:hypothetical protein [Planctomycetes bacterium Pan216]|uniref:hypothetical protein n=1 Tax=Kolteria novifilia TaxID=2527975 RepID=UPI0011AA2EFB
MSTDENAGYRWLDSTEFRTALLEGGDELRSNVLWHFERVLENESADERREWQTRANNFFKDVWPRQREVKTPEVSARLLEFLVSHPDTFTALVDAVSPLLMTIENGMRYHVRFPPKAEDLIRSNPERFLHVMDIVLSENARDWPWGIVLKFDEFAKVWEAEDSLRSDPRFIELRRRWNTR